MTHTPPYLTHRFDNGLTLLGGPMPWLRTAAFSLCLPGGYQYEAEPSGGLAAMVCEMVQRGAGSRNSRQVVAAQDNLGLDRSAGVTTAHTAFGAAMPAESLAEALALYADIVRRPHLPENQLNDARQVAFQELRAAEDEPVQRVMKQLRPLHYGPVLGRSSYGTVESLTAIDARAVQEFYRDNYHPGEAILAVAGQFDWAELLAQVETLFADWQPRPGRSVPEIPESGSQYVHLEHDSQQTHIGFAYPAVPYSHPDYYTLRAGIGVLSDGMSSRLFDRVREQRGLCYTVMAGCHSLRTGGGVLGYAGTTVERAQETLDVTLREIEAIVEGVGEDELERQKVRVQSGLIMEQESSASRASSMASDWYHLQRIMLAEEIERRIDAITSDDIVAHWKAHPPGHYRIVTLGPEPLKAP
jgi:predicted Zn-dependent peptidase